MAQTTRTTPRTTPRTGTGAGAGRFGRPGAAQTRARRTTPRRTPATRTTPRGRTPQMPARFSRKPKQQKGIAGTLTGLLPTGAASKATPSSKKGKAGGFAALAAMAGVAFKNRDKFAGMMNRKGGSSDQEIPSQPTYATTPAPAPVAPSAQPRDTTPGI